MVKVKNKKEKGITLIALVITIIVLLILAGVSIAMLTGENGLLNKARISKVYARKGQAEELLNLELNNIQAEKLGEATLNDIASDLAKDEKEEFTIIKITSKEEARLKDGITILQGIVGEIDVVVKDYEEFIFTIGEGIKITKICGIPIDEWKGQTVDSEKTDETRPTEEYILSYEANGGIGAPNSQTQYDNTIFTISSTEPTKEGYVFKSWNTKQDGTGTSYNPGASITITASTTLYAQWKKTYEISDIVEKKETVNMVLVENEQTVPVPKNFYYVGGNLSTGVIISDNEADKYEKGIDKTTYAYTTKLKGNQFVWIPCSTNDYKKTNWGNSYESSDWEENIDSSELNQIQKYYGFYIARYESGLAKTITEYTEEQQHTGSNQIYNKERNSAK